MITPRFRILALDVDGTLLDRDGTLRASTVEAVDRASRAGIQPILCTGRRYRRALPIAERLRLQTPLVCNSGALLKDPRDHRTLWRADLAVPLLVELLAIFRERDEPVLSFTDRSPEDRDFLVCAEPSGRPHFDDYLAMNPSHAEVSHGWVDRPGPGHYHLCAIGARPSMLDFERVVHERLPGQARTFVQTTSRYSGTMCEIIRRDASKWSALLQLADRWGIDPSEICAVGDDMNDVPMLQGAGLGVAMGHASPEVRAVADRITGSDLEDGVAMLVDDVLLA